MFIRDVAKGVISFSALHFVCWFVLFCFCLFRATPLAHGSFQARGLRHSHSNTRSKSRLRPTLQTYTTAHGSAGSLTHWVRPVIEPASSWVVVMFLTAMPRWELLYLYCFFPFPFHAQPILRGYLRVTRIHEASPQVFCLCCRSFFFFFFFFFLIILFLVYIYIFLCCRSFHILSNNTEWGKDQSWVEKEILREKEFVF